MAFSDDQKAQIRKYLCATKRFLDFTAQYYSLEDAMDQVGNDATTSTVIVTALTALDAIETKMVALHELAHVDKAEDVTLKPAAGLLTLRKEGRRQIRIIANALGLDPLGDYYSAPSIGVSTGWVS